MEFGEKWRKTYLVSFWDGHKENVTAYTEQEAIEIAQMFYAELPIRKVEVES